VDPGDARALSLSANAQPRSLGSRSPCSRVCQNAAALHTQYLDKHNGSPGAPHSHECGYRENGPSLHFSNRTNRANWPPYIGLFLSYFTYALPGADGGLDVALRTVIMRA